MFVVNVKKRTVAIALILAVVLIGILVLARMSMSLVFANASITSPDCDSQAGCSEKNIKKKFIKYVEFNPCFEAMSKAMNEDISSHKNDVQVKVNWVEILACLGAKYGGDFKKYREKDLNEILNKLKKGQKIEDIAANLKQYSYFSEAYGAVLGEFVGKYKIGKKNNQGETVWEENYGLKVFSPIAKGFPYNHYDDFGAKRSFGFSRPHLGHDLMGAIGTPVVAVESGIVECMGWNRYGGWRLGIRSFDKKRYYYYAHLRKDRPYHVDMSVGRVVKAGDVIGYIGRTGYSDKENVNNIRENHLHLGLQLIFDESQKECNNEIWVDLYAITKLLEKNRSAVLRKPETKDYYRENEFCETNLLNFEQKNE